jgi:EAL domain-containing protein (putative c-di-GMP-specific phosphodiesterase class I)
MQKEFLWFFNIEKKLRDAITHDDFYLKYQPVIDTLSKKITGVEALIRWDVDDEFKSPDKFIPIAEKSRLIIEIGNSVIQKAIKQLAVWNKNRTVPLTMAINVSTVQLTDDLLLKTLSDALSEHDVCASLIEIELTETALIIEPTLAVKVIQAISDLGCKISLDDFGTGFSSLSHLHRFPINIVKIDKSLMPTATSNEKIEQLLTGLALMIQSLGLKVTAEGVETENDLNLCLKLKVDKIQ